MDRKKLLWGGMIVGSTVGAYLPMLWGENALFSFSSVMFTFIGGIAGIWGGLWLSKKF